MHEHAARPGLREDGGCIPRLLRQVQRADVDLEEELGAHTGAVEDQHRPAFRHPGRVGNRHARNLEGVARGHDP
jgi:hypothetical protein